MADLIDLLSIANHDRETLRRWLGRLRHFRVRVASPFVQYSDYADDLRARVRLGARQRVRELSDALDLLPPPEDPPPDARIMVVAPNVALRRRFLSLESTPDFVELVFSGSQSSVWTLDDATVDLAAEVEQALEARHFTFLSLDGLRPFISYETCPELANEG
jgi:hypothetical protein